MIIATVQNGELFVEGHIVSDSIKTETVKFNFPPEWDGYIKTAVFTLGEQQMKVILHQSNSMCLSETQCYIPYEIALGGNFNLTVFGIKDDSVITSTVALVTVKESGYDIKTDSLNPTPNEYQQILSLTAKTTEIANDLKNAADSGAFKGEKGDKGEQGIQGEKGEKGDKGDKGDDGIILNLDQTYNPTSENAQSGKAVAEGLANKKDKNTLSDFVGYTITDESPNGTVALMYVRDKNISGNVVIPDYIDGYPVEIPWEAFMNCALLKSVTLPKYASDISEMFIGCTSLETVVLQEGVNSITGATFSGCTSLKDIYYAGSKEQWESIQGVNAEFSEPLKNATVHYNHGTATKEYVLENAQTKFVSFLNGETIEIGNNTIYEATEKITNLTVTYPEENFIGSIIFTLADEGNIAITLPESKYIGGVPTFANGETWELNIRNGIVVGGRVE